MMKYFDKKLLKFIAVGILNTLVGSIIQFGVLNFLNVVHPSDLNYYIAVPCNYIPTSIMSFFLNKYFTFKSKGNLVKEAIRFALNIVVCMVLAYAIAEPITKLLMNSAPESVFDFIKSITFGFLNDKKNIIDNVATIVGMVLFVILNYTGQRFFAFKAEE